MKLWYTEFIKLFLASVPNYNMCGDNMKKRNFIIFVIILSISFLVSFSENPFAEENNSQKVRIGWFDAPALHGEDDNGNKVGYDYDYLEALRQYTNWEYEYVEDSFSECYDWLKNGEIDLMGIVNKNPEREKIFDYSDTPQGTEYCNLLVLENNNKYAYHNYEDFNGMVIGIEEGTYQLSLLENFAKENNFTFRKKIFAIMSDASKALENGEIDAMLASNTDAVSSYMSNEGKYKRIAEFSPTSYYFVVTKGNKVLLKELNQAMMNLTVYNPTFATDLYNKYYGVFYSDVLTFTEKEKEFIESNPEVYILYDVNWPPIEFYDEKEKIFKGVSPSIIKLINENSGLNIEPVDYQNSVEVLKDFQDGKLKNALTCLTYDFNWAKKNKVSITQPFATTTIVNVTKDRGKALKTVAVVEVDFITEMVKKHFPNLELIIFDNVVNCLDAVADGKVDCTYINGFQSEYYMSTPKYKNLFYHTIDAFTQPICIGVSEDADPNLFSVMNKSLASISKENINTILFSNSNKESGFSLSSYIQRHPIRAIIFLGIVFILLMAIGYGITNKEIKNKNKVLLQYNRYNELMGMVGDIFFEYNYDTKDIKFRNLPTYIDKEELSKRTDEAKNDIDYIFHYISQGIDTNVDMDILCNDDIKRCFELDLKIIEDEKDVKRYAIGKLKNVDKERKEIRDLIEEATRDSMTKLLNQESFKQMTQSALNESGTLILIDIDDFKNINDNYGHDIGDEVIKQVAEIIKNSSRNNDIAGRIGGDEFGLFLIGLTVKEDVNKICERINENTGQIKVSDSSNRVSLSIGAVISDGKESYEKIFKLADKELYSVKNSGKGSHSVIRIS